MWYIYNKGGVLYTLAMQIGRKKQPDKICLYIDPVVYSKFKKKIKQKERMTLSKWFRERVDKYLAVNV